MSGRGLVEEVHGVINQAGQPIGHQAGQGRPRGQLESLAERAQEVDEGVDANRTRPGDNPVAFGCRAGGNAVWDSRMRHGPSVRFGRVPQLILVRITYLILVNITHPGWEMPTPARGHAGLERAIHDPRQIDIPVDCC